MSVVFFQGIFANFDQVNRVLHHHDPLFPECDLVSISNDLPEIITDTNSLSYTIQTWMVSMVFGLLFRPYLVRPYAIDYSALNFAQHNDIAQHRLRGVGDIAFGISRGAATTFSRWALDGTEGSGLRPKLLVLEGCPDSISNVLQHRFGDFLASYIESVMEIITQYNKTIALQLAPIALAKQFPLDLPVAFITSLRDTKVPMQGTLDLAQALRERGHPHVYLLVLQDAGHNDYYTGSSRDHQAYKTFFQNLVKTFVK